jgi:hypothetical protein
MPIRRGAAVTEPWRVMSSPARDHPPEPARWNIVPAMTGSMEHRAGWTSGQTRHSHDQASRANQRNLTQH